MSKAALGPVHGRLAAQAVQQAAEAAATTADLRQQRAQDRRQAQAARSDDHHHGQFGGYLFRPSRNRAPLKPPRPSSLRRRPPPPPGAGLEIGADQPAATVSLPLIASLLDIDDEPPVLDIDFDMAGENGSGGSSEEERMRGRRLAQQWRLCRQPSTDTRAGTAQTTAPAAVTTPAQVPMSMPSVAFSSTTAAPASTTESPPLSAEMKARLLVRRLLDLVEGPRHMGPANLLLDAVRTYLLDSVDVSAFATLQRVKQALLEGRAERSSGKGTATPDEAQEDRHVLLPLLLLNAGRPRTGAQRLQACDRISLISGLPPPQGIRA